jgi:mannonate dehydratase
MKLGLGLYKSILTEDNFRFAKQAGASHIVVQLVDYIKGGDSPSLTRDYLDGWGTTLNKNKLWEYEDLLALKKSIESQGLVWEAVENFDPAHWYDILLDGPEKQKQLDNLKYMIRNLGKVGVKIIGYYFSLAGVWGWTSRPSGRAGARSIEFEQSKIDTDRPIPRGMVWNMTYDPQAQEGDIGTVTEEEIWQRLSDFLHEIIPVAEENSIMMAAHPDDPPLPELRGTARLITNPSGYDRLLDVVDSPSNGIEFCMGTTQEMASGDIYECLDKYSSMDKIAYVHFRNVKGKVPHYREVFVDEGDIDMVKALKILKNNGFNGVVIPDHTPEMTCGAPWHAGMAYAMGFMKGAISAMEHE